MTVQRDQSLTIKPTRCTNFSNLFLDWKSTCFGQFLCPSSGVFHCTHSKPVWNIPLLCVQWKTPDDGQRNCLKHVEFQSKNKYEKLVHLVGFIIRNKLNTHVFWDTTLYTMRIAKQLQMLWRSVLPLFSLTLVSSRTNMKMVIANSSVPSAPLSEPHDT